MATNPQHKITVERDGTDWVAHFDDFVDLQASDAGFGKTPGAAILALYTLCGIAPDTRGTALIAEERARQIDEEGYGALHDDDFDTDAFHQDGELALAACYYAMPDELELKVHAEVGGKPLATPIRIILEPLAFWPEHWLTESAKRGSKDQIRRLVVSGALLASEIDRLHRVDAKKET